MTNYDKKEEKVIDNIVKVLTKLDDNLGKLDTLEDYSKKHSIKTWYYEKESIHDIKKIISDINKYDKYDEKEMEKVDKEFESLIN